MIISEAKKSKKSIPETISFLLDKVFDIKADVNDIREAFLKMKLSDILNLNTAFDNKDEVMVRQLLSGYLNEYSMPGRANIKSSAPPVQKNTQQTPNQVVIQPKDNTQQTAQAPDDTKDATLSPSELATQKEIEKKEQEQMDLQKELENIKKSAGIK